MWLAVGIGRRASPAAKAPESFDFDQSVLQYKEHLYSLKLGPIGQAYVLGIRDSLVTVGMSANRGSGRDLHFPPVPNGVDYLLSVVQHLKRGQNGPTPRDLKYAVLHLQAASEVLLKARLQVEHWTLTVKDASKTNRESHESGEFESPTHAETLRRLTDVLGIPIDQKDKKTLLGLAKTRNALQHWGMTESAPAVEARAADVLDFLIRFLDEHLLDMLSGAEIADIQGDMDMVREGLSEISAYVKSRMDRLREELGDVGDRVIQCPDCAQFALAVDGAENKCHFCVRLWNDGEGLASSYVSEILNFSWRDLTRGGESPKVDCPSCGADTLVLGVAVWTPVVVNVNFCFSCLEEFANLDSCLRCGSLYVPEEEETICSDCFDDLASRD